MADRQRNMGASDAEIRITEIIEYGVGYCVGNQQKTFTMNNSVGNRYGLGCRIKCVILTNYAFGHELFS